MKTKSEIQKLVAKIKATKTKIETAEGRKPIHIPHPSEKYYREINMLDDAHSQGAHGTDIIKEGMYEPRN